MEKRSLFKTSRHGAELRVGLIFITFIEGWEISLLKDDPLMLQPININEFPLEIPYAEEFCSQIANTRKS